MPSLKETKDRIVSVNSTRKITSAMKMVASSKLHHAQTLISNMLPYEKSLEHILKSFLAAMPDVRTPLNVPHADVKRVALVVFTSNSSLCGGFNNNVIKLMEQTVAEYKAQGASDILVYPVGRKVAEKVTKLGLPVAGNFTELADKPTPKVVRTFPRSCAVSLWQERSTRWSLSITTSRVPARRFCNAVCSFPSTLPTTSCLMPSATSRRPLPLRRLKSMCASTVSRTAGRRKRR